MKYLRTLTSTSLVFLSLISIGQSDVLALIYETRGDLYPTCQGLQDAANKIKWDKKTKFQGFEENKIIKEALPQYMDHPGGSIIALAYNYWMCKGGYVTLESPLGKRVCEGTLYAYITTEMKKPKMHWAPGYSMSTGTTNRGNYPTEDEARFCRYIN
jgi:hypothetical protein